MSRISKTIQMRLEKGGKVVIPYLVAGDPNLSSTLQLMRGLVAAGADIIELGVPFSDPSSDGPVIQLGAERSLARGTTLLQIIDLVRQFRLQDSDTPIVLMGYLNPIEIMGYEAFVTHASEAGVDGVLIVDMPPNEATRMIELLKNHQMDCIFLVAPTTSETRAAAISQACSGYLYYVSLKGVTGAAISDTESIEQNVKKLRNYSSLPIVIGFGIKDEESAASMSQLADGIVIGSALVEKIARLSDIPDQDPAEVGAVTSLIASVSRRLNNNTY